MFCTSRLREDGGLEFAGRWPRDPLLPLTTGFESELGQDLSQPWSEDSRAVRLQTSLPSTSHSFKHGINLVGTKVMSEGLRL